MNVTLERASPENATELAELKSKIWPDENTPAEYLAEIIKQDDHSTQVARSDGRLVGFVDGFLTLQLDGKRRWELDLIGVDPAYQRRGIARQLLMTNTLAGQALGAEVARGLVATRNIGSQRTFSACGYTLNPQVCRLYVCAADISLPFAGAEGHHLIPVHTFNYRGVWVEGRLSPDNFALALKARQRHGLDLVGAVIPLHETAAMTFVEQVGFDLIGDYQFWERDLTQIGL